MKIKLLAADSLGVRSMVTFIETRDINILIDPAAALGPRRYGLPPHKVEKEALEYAWRIIEEFAVDADVVIVTHYHYDHHSRKRSVEKIYRDKILFLKDPQSYINPSQQWRAKVFLKKINGIPKDIFIGDGKDFFVGDTHIIFSHPVPHGERGTKLGYVLEVFVDDQEDSFLFTSDVEGLLDDSQVEFIMRTRPRIIYIDGPPTYLGPGKLPDDLLRVSIDNISKVTDIVKPDAIIIDHHLLRDLDYKQKMGSVHFITAAEFMNMPIRMLEAMRRELWGK